MVTLAVDLEDGMRQIKEFDPNQSLWDVIHCLFENNPILNLEQNMQFSIIYVQKEISGEKDLKETNLKSLGLIQGRAAMKLLVRPINASKDQAFVESLDLKKFAKHSDIEKNSDVSQKTQQISPKIETRSEDNKQTTDMTTTQIKDGTENIESIAPSAQVQQSIEAIDEPMEEPPKDVQQMEVSSDESSDEDQEILNYLGGNHSEILFKMSDLPKVSKKEYPDEFYETTRDDLMHVLNDLRKQQAADSLKPLETQRMREQKRREQMVKYKTTVVRICFPNDKLVFQAIFKPTDTVEDVKRVIRQYICSDDDFYLYTVPPKRILKSESSLFESELVPAALIHFGINSTHNKNIIKEEYKTKLTSYKSAAKIATNARNNGKQIVLKTSEPTLRSSAPNDSSNQREGNCGQKEAKVPKWFKTN